MERLTVGDLKKALKDVPENIYIYMGPDELPVCQIKLVEELTNERETYLHLRDTR